MGMVHSNTGVFLSARSRAAVCDVAEALGADVLCRIITGEGLQLPAAPTPMLPVLSSGPESSNGQLLVNALAAMSQAHQSMLLLKDARRLAERCFAQLDWSSAAVTLAALQAVEELLWEFDQILARDDELDPLPGERLRRALATDGFLIDADGRIQPPATLYLHRSLACVTDPAVILVLLARVRKALPEDPMLAIGTAKELVESTAKIVLDRLAIAYSPAASLPSLVTDAQRALTEHPSCVPDGLDADKEVKRLLGALSTTSNALAALRNSHGAGHGPAALPRGLRPRHGRLALAAADAWCTYILDALTDLLTPAPALPPAPPLTPKAAIGP